MKPDFITKVRLHAWMCLLVLLPLTAEGQQLTITGNVVDENGETLPGVTVVVEGTTTFDEVVTDGIRLNFINSAESTDISEWQVMGIGDPMIPEERPIADVLPNGTSTWDPSTSTLTLNYKVIYEDATYYTNASSSLVWRNRIRDGVNEWRR